MEDNKCKVILIGKNNWKTMYTFQESKLIVTTQERKFSSIVSSSVKASA